MPEQQNLAEALQNEIRRVRDDVMPAYLELDGSPGVNVNFALTSMRRDLDAATKALAEQDAVECVRLYKALQGYSV